MLELVEDTEQQDTTREIADALLAVCNYFVAKHNGLRSAENRRKRKERQREERLKAEQKRKEKLNRTEKIPI